MLAFDMQIVPERRWDRGTPRVAATATASAYYSWDYPSAGLLVLTQPGMSERFSLDKYNHFTETKAIAKNKNGDLMPKKPDIYKKCSIKLFIIGILHVLAFQRVVRS